jgi:hypothetical protein
VRQGFVAALVAAALTSTLFAQWPDRSTPGIPRLPDGSVNLKAPAPRMTDGKVDLSGIWRVKAGRNLQGNIALGVAEPPMLPTALKLYDQRRATQGREHPRVRCLPRGIPNAMLWGGGPFKFFHTPGITLILFEEFVTYRQVFTDGRSLPTDAQPAWWGYSIGRWEPEAFVVETTGFQHEAWLDFQGHPASDAMRITERFRRINFGEMEAEFTFNDPKTYSRSWAVTAGFDYMPDSEFIEHVCENEYTYERLSGVAR